MKNFLKKNLAVIIFIGVLLVAGAILGVAIYRVSSKVQPEVVVKNNIVLSYSGSAKEVVIDKEVVSIAAGAFDGKTTIEKVTFEEGSSLKSIGASAFKDCTSLKVIVLPKGLETIGSHAFDNCTSLETIIIPEGVTSIENYAFYGCRNLKTISFPASLDNLGDNVLSNCLLLESLSSKSNKFIVDDGILFNNDKTILYKYLRTNQATSYVVPETVKEIKSYAFQEAALLKTLTVGSHVEVIGEQPFAGCVNLVEVTVPFLGSSAKAEDAAIFGAFFDDIPDTLTTVTVLGGEIIPFKAFEFCSKLQKIVIGEGVVEIGESAFRQCSKVSRIELPSTIKYIGSGAFKGCNKNGRIYINQTEKEFDNNWNPDGIQVIFLVK